MLFFGDGFADGFEFVAEYGALYFELIVFSVFIFADIFLIEIDAFGDFFEAVVVESIEIEEF